MFTFTEIYDAIIAAPDDAPLLPTLPDRAAPHLRTFYAELRADAERARTTPIPALPYQLFRLFEQCGDRAQFEAVYIDRRRRLVALALAAKIDSDTTNLLSLHEIIWEICNEYTWSLPAHLPVGLAAVQAHRLPPEQVIDLFAAHTAHALAETLTLLSDQVDDWLRFRVQSEIERRIFTPLYQTAHRFKWEWEPINWAAVCGGCVGMSALILERDRERLAGMIERVVRAMDVFLSGFSDDGACLEGIGYWDYGFGYFVYFAEMLRAFTGGKLDLLDSERVRRIAAFPQTVALGDGRFVNFSDASAESVIHPGLCSRLMQRLGQSVPLLAAPNFHAVHVYRWADIVRDLCWTDAAALDLPVAPGQFFLPDIGWIVDRRKFAGRVVAFAAKGGHNEEPHNHNDLGHFVLHIGGENILADLGAGLYTRQYFSDERYDALHTGSHGHSVPIIGGQVQEAGKAFAGKVIAHELRSDGAMLALDLAGAYADVAQFERRFEWRVGGDSADLHLTDIFALDEPAQIEERFISLHHVSVTDDTATWHGEHGSLTLRFDDNVWSPEVLALATHDHAGRPMVVTCLSLTSLSTKSLQAVFHIAVRPEQMMPFQSIELSTI